MTSAGQTRSIIVAVSDRSEKLRTHYSDDARMTRAVSLHTLGFSFSSYKLQRSTSFQHGQYFLTTLARQPTSRGREGGGFVVYCLLS